MWTTCERDKWSPNIACGRRNIVNLSQNHYPGKYEQFPPVDDENANSGEDFTQEQPESEDGSNNADGNDLDLEPESSWENLLI